MADQRAKDIIELERLLNDGEGDDMLCAQAIKIFERLEREMNDAGRRQSDVLRREAIKRERADFKVVLQSIRDRRHAGVLNQYDQYQYRRRRKSP